MNDSFLLIGLQFSVVSVVGLIVAMYLVLAVYTITWTSIAFAIQRLRTFIRMAGEKPSATPVVPLAGSMPLPAIRRKVAFK